MKILFLSRWFPFPPDNGSKLRIYHLLRGLSEVHEVTLLSFVNENAPRMKQNQFCEKIETVLWKPYNSGSLRAKLGFLSSTPRSILDTYSSQMDALIRDSLAQQKYDLVVASQFPMAAYYPCFQGVPALFEEVELGLFFDQANTSSAFKQFRYGLTWTKFRRYLSKLLDSFQACTVVSEQERQLFTDSFPEHHHKVNSIPNCVNADDYRNVEVNPKKHQLIFSGSFRYHANYEAMVWFVDRVFPLVLEQVPDAQLVITGDHANLPLPSNRNINLAGYVDDIAKLIASSSVSIAPLWSGGGTRLKILEAMALGTPVVSTSKGAEGLNVTPGEHLLTANTADDFASDVVRVLKDEELQNKLVLEAKKLVEEQYDWSVVLPRFLQIAENTSARLMIH